MALTHTQGYVDGQNEDNLFKAAARLIAAKEKVVLVKAEVLNIAAVIDADTNASTELKTLATQAVSAMNNSKITDFITFIESNLG